MSAHLHEQLDRPNQDAMAEYLDAAFDLFPEDKLEAAGWLGEGALIMLDGALEKDLKAAGYNTGTAPRKLWEPDPAPLMMTRAGALERAQKRDAQMDEFGRWLDKRFRPVDRINSFELAIAFDQLGVDPLNISLPDDSLTDIKLPELKDKNVLVMDRGNSAMLSENDNVGLAIACLGGRTTFVKTSIDPGGLGFPVDALKSELGSRIELVTHGGFFGYENRLSRGYEIGTGLPIYSPQYDFIHFGGPNHAFPQASPAAVSITALNRLLCALKPDGMMLFTDSAQSQLTNILKELGEQRSEEIVDEWQGLGISPIVYPRYGVNPEDHRARYSERADSEVPGAPSAGTPALALRKQSAI